MTLTYIVDQLNMIVTNQSWYSSRNGSFKVAENYEIDEIGEDNYPMFVVELPVEFSYDGRFETSSLSLTLLDLCDLDNAYAEVEVIDWAKTKMKYILDLLAEDTEIAVDKNYNMLSMQRFSNDVTSGIRVDLNIKAPLTLGACDPEEEENDNC